MGHVSGKRRYRCIGFYLVGFAFCITVFAVQQDSLNGMQKNGKIQHIGNGFDQGILRHKMRIDIKGLATIMGEQLQISEQVYQ